MFIATSKGTHEMSCNLNQRDVKYMLDRFYDAVRRENMKYYIVNTRVDKIGGRLKRYVVTYCVTE